MTSACAPPRSGTYFVNGYSWMYDNFFNFRGHDRGWVRRRRSLLSVVDNNNNVNNDTSVVPMTESWIQDGAWIADIQDESWTVADIDDVSEYAVPMDWQAQGMFSQVGSPAHSSELASLIMEKSWVLRIVLNPRSSAVPSDARSRVPGTPSNDSGLLQSR
jgi:hypothetical protein